MNDETIEYIYGTLEPYFVITPVYKFVDINTLKIKILDSYEIESCFVETNRDGSVNYHTAFLDDNKFSFAEYENSLISLSMNTGKIDNNKYVFQTKEEAEKILTKLLYYTFDNAESEKLKMLLEKYPEAII